MKILCKNKHWKFNEECNIDKILYLLVDRPNRITSYNNNNNNYIWKNEVGGWHKDYDLPAFIQNDGYVCWYKNHSLHRDNDKPTVIYKTGKKIYYINNNFIRGEK